jgi:6-methylsalicylate decarboxylase
MKTEKPITGIASKGAISTSRRDVLSMLSAAGATVLMAPHLMGEQPAGSNPRIIDTHHHIYPQRFVAENLAELRGLPQPLSYYESWAPNRALEEMDKAGVASAIVSISTPGIWYNDGEKARTRARYCNEFGAQMSRDFPGRFGMFAAIPLPDTEGSLKEIAYALDVLRLDGIGLLSSYAGKLLGAAAFRPVFEELNRRKAVVFVHPTMPCCGNLSQDALGLNPVTLAVTIELTADTARTITSLLLSGTFAALPDIQFIFSHGGGVLPSMVERLPEAAYSLTPAERALKLPHGIDYELRRQHYDLASVALNPAGMAAVLKLFPISQLTYGSDAPFHMPLELADALTRLGLSTGDLHAIQRENALRLFPRFGA